MKQLLHVILAKILKLFATISNKNSQLVWLKKIDEKELKVVLYIRGNKQNSLMNLHEVVSDAKIISGLSSKSSSVIGYYFGLNYVKITQRIKDIRSSFCVDSDSNYSNRIIAIDRKNNIIYASNKKLDKNPLTMHPYDILNKENLLNDFHPLQAFHIGLQAGLINRKAIKEQL